MKKFLALLLAAFLALSLLAACGSESSETVAVRKVRDIVSDGSIALVSRYAGIVVSGESAEVKKDADMKVLTVNVAEGDMVKAGDVLFSYDTEAMQLKLEKLHLEYEELQNKKASAEESIPAIEKKLRTANATDQLAYNLQIQTYQADILESTYNMSLKEREIAALEAAMENVDVSAPISGRIMAVNENSSDSSSSSGMGTGEGQQSDAFITVTDIGTLRIKGTINEMNAGTMREGMPVILRSRIDSTVTWSGVLEKIDWENTVKDNNNYYYMSDEMTTTTKYPFYVALDDFTGLLLGQHVYIEPDYGQETQKQGLWLPEYYILQEEGSAFVWAENSRGKLEKRAITLGENDPEDGTVLILSGLSFDDSIAFPEESNHAGMLCVPYEDSMFVDPGEASFSEEFFSENTADDGNPEPEADAEPQPEEFPAPEIPEGLPNEGSAG